MKILGLDVGSRTIGVAVSDALGWTAQGLTTIEWQEENIKSADQPLKEIISKHEVEKVVIGLPKHMNGSIGERGEASQAFAKHVQNTYDLPVVLWDERLSTMTAERTLLEADMSRAKRAEVIDKVAAVVILQNYLDAQ